MKWLRRSLTEKKIQKIISSNSIGMRPNYNYNRCDLLLLLQFNGTGIESVNTPHTHAHTCQNQREGYLHQILSRMPQHFHCGMQLKLAARQPSTGAGNIGTHMTPLPPRKRHGASQALKENTALTTQSNYGNTLTLHYTKSERKSFLVAF